MLVLFVFQFVLKEILEGEMAMLKDWLMYRRLYLIEQTAAEKAGGSAHAMS